jgi:hypothetical protein
MEGEHAEVAEEWPARARRLEEIGEHAEVYHERAEVEAEREGAWLLLRRLNLVVRACFAEVRVGAVVSSLALRWLQLHSSERRARSF